MEGVRVPFEAIAGASYLARVEQLDVDATLELLDGQGRSLRRVVSPAGALGREYLFWTAATSERLYLAIRAVSPPASSARYRAAVFRMPPQLASEKIAALQALTQAASASPDALRDLQVAEATWRRSGNPQLAADTALRLAGQLYFKEERWSPAQQAAHRAVVGLAALRDPVAEAGARLLEGAAQLELARTGEQSAALYRAAYQSLSQARALFQRQRQPVSAATVLRYQGAGQFSEGAIEPAMASYQQAAIELAVVGESRERLSAMISIAAIRASRGEYREAVTLFDQALPLLVGSDPALRATVLQNSATALQAIGLSELALQRYLDSLDIANALHDPSLAARALTGLGAAHLRLGQSALAVNYLTQAVDMIRPLQDRDRLAVVLNSLGDAYAGLHDSQSAMRLRREAVATLSPTATPMRRARLTVALANELANRGQASKALELYSTVVNSKPTLQDAPIIDALVGRAKLQRSAGRLTDAQRDVARAVQLARGSGDRERWIRAMAEQARVVRQQGDARQALNAAEAAVTLTEELQALTANPDNRVTLAAQLRDVYDLKIELLAESAQRAARRGDRAGARRLALQALLMVDHAANRFDADHVAAVNVSAGDVALDALYESLSGKRQRQQELTERNSVATAAMLTLQQEIAVLQSRLASRTQQRAGSGTTRATTPPTVDGLQSRIPRDSAVLAFRLGATQSWLWLLSRDRFELHRLPAGPVIDRLIVTLLRNVTALRPRTTIDTDVSALRAALLPGTLRSALASRVFVLPDGSIGALPWALLVRDVAAAVTDIGTLRSLTSVRTPRPVFGSTSASPRIALIGDPVFGANDPRLGARVMRADLPAMTALPRLRGSAAELDAIAALDSTAIVLRASGFSATRSTVLNQRSDTVDVLHLATHATLDADVPALAALVLSRFDARGHYLPGELRPRDILRMVQPPPLVVLSACDTATDPSKNAPGLMNLSRAFLGAGSHSVVASLWPVSDVGAVAFMTEFYRGLLRERLRPAAALASAQATLAGSPRFSEPFFWSGFVLISEEP